MRFFIDFGTNFDACCKSQHQKKEKTCTKIYEKLHIFWDLDFEWILGGFWEGFGRPKSSIFAFFSMFFRCHFSSAVGKAKKTTKMGQQDAESNFYTLGSGDPQAGGERKG